MMTMRAPFVIALLAAVSSGSAYAACSATGGFSQLSAAQITTLLSGTTACYPVSPPYENQEFLSGGNLMDYKKGSSDPVDPTKQIGGYVIDAGDANHTGEITYNYTGGANYTYTVWGTSASGPGNYDFCVGASPITIRVASGVGGC
jgi:hypothetical protein